MCIKNLLEMIESVSRAFGTIAEEALDIDYILNLNLSYDEQTLLIDKATQVGFTTLCLALGRQRLLNEVPHLANLFWGTK